MATQYEELAENIRRESQDGNYPSANDWMILVGILGDLHELAPEVTVDELATQIHSRIAAEYNSGADGFFDRWWKAKELLAFEEAAH